MSKITYLNQCLKKSAIVRWPDHCMPLKVYIAPFRWYKAKEEGYAYQQMVMDALNIWQNASRGAVSFQIVNTLNESQINIEWKRVDRNSLGYCYFNYDNLGRFFSAEVQIGLSDGILHAQYQDQNEVFHTIIHEIGHAVGLSHSPFAEDIMYVPHQYGCLNVSKRDVNTLYWMYKFPYGTHYENVLASYNMPEARSLDELIYLISQKGRKSKFESVKNEVQNNMPKRDLKDEQNLLADINKYNLSLQNIGLPKTVDDYIRLTRMNKDLDKK